MDEVWAATRTVVLLGRNPSEIWHTLRDGGLGQELVILSIGYPVSSAQRRFLLEAQELAGREGSWFDARLVTSLDEALSLLEPEDEIHVSARGRFGKRVKMALQRVGGSSLD